MADSLLDQLKELVTPEIVARVGGALGESEENIAKGFGAAAPALLSGLVSRATEGQGAERILSLVNDTDNDGSILSNTESLLSDTVATTPLHGLGQTLMGGLLSGKSEEVAEGIAQESGLQKGAALKILGFLSPLLLGLLSKNLGPSAVPSSLLGLVSAQKDSVLSALSGNMAEKLGGIVNLGALSGVPTAPAVAVEEVAATAASSVVGGLGSLAVDATPVIPSPEAEPPIVEAPIVEVPTIEAPAVEIEPPVTDTVVVETPIVEEPIVEAPVVDEPIVEPVIVAVEPVEEVPPVAFSIPEAPEEAPVVAIDESIELPEPVVNITEEPAEVVETVVEPVVFEPVDEVAEVATDITSVDVAAEDTVPFPEVVSIDAPDEVDTHAVVDAVDEVYTPVTADPEPVEPVVEAAVDVDTAVEVEAVGPEVEPADASVEAVEEAVSTARAAIDDASDHLVGSANVMLKPDPQPGPPKWVVPVVAVLALGGLAYYFLVLKKPAPTTPPAKTGGTTTPGTPADALPEATTDVKLPDGNTFKAVPGGTEEKLVAFAQDASKPVDENTWFNFDRLRFEVGKASLKPESRPQIENIVAVLNAFPNLHVKIGGYTDNSGTKEGNLQLSGARATAVMKAITGRKIAPDRIEAEGYGDQNPACPANDTDACKEQNRRVAIRVTKK